MKKAVKSIYRVTHITPCFKSGGAYTELVSIGPELVQIRNINYSILGSGLRRI